MLGLIKVSKNEPGANSRSACFFLFAKLKVVRGKNLPITKIQFFTFKNKKYQNNIKLLRFLKVGWIIFDANRVSFRSKVR